MRVGFIGLGSQGGPMARRIAGAGHRTTLWARRPATLAPFTDSGARTAGSPAELAAASDLVCLCVVDDADVEQVVTGPDGVLAGLRRGGVIAVHSTVHPETCRRLAAVARTSGVALLDAPVSGGGRAAEQGTLVVMAGGDPQVFSYCRPVFETYGDPVVHLGPTGSGQLAKILNNVLFTAQLGLAADALGVAAALGLDRAELSRVLSCASAAGFALDRVADAGGTLDRIAAHAGGLLAKDVRLFADLADAAGAGTAATLRGAARAALASMGN
ncbi:NAD(P)-dependent oxidoreductase [Streptomyces fuscichromogenes]|uniref:6-phosphogluconate dehydrogenase n=1 Tax=Streptomyces fuscichromogenes TaxID=1324013 RepID=A0A917XL10_9ACTN|nr:NAD(P)-dependent oxidoreductase [Streptomyces fuscichromogenes]GGN36740.1 6-phosphogluconate dehydrogenase [Streptomyces fuscichromogenes]